MNGDIIKITGRSTLIKKYFWSWFIPLVVVMMVIVIKLSLVVSIVIVIASVGLGLFYFNISELSYNSTTIFLGKEKRSFRELSAIRSIEVNRKVFLILKFNGHTQQRKKYYIDTGNLSFFEMLLDLLGFQSSFGKFAKFLDYAKKQIASNKTIK